MHKVGLRDLVFVGSALLGCGGTVIIEGAGGSGGDGVAPGTGIGTSTSNNTGTSTSSTTGTSTSTGTGTSTVTGTGPGTGTGFTCVNEPDCFDCCLSSEPVALELINQYFFDACVCGNGAPCQMSCDVFCMNPNQPVDACEACIDTAFNNGDACIEEYLFDCQNDPQCQPLIECAGACP